jgi:ketosteroid isomerase-like protein
LRASSISGETPRAEPSEEIRRVVIRFFEALRDGDEEAVNNRISRQPGFERFGTDAVERWQDADAAARVWIQVMREIDGYPWRLIGDVHAMSEGSVGWAGARAEFDAAEGPVELRFTCVLHLEHGEWRLVQWHGSVPSSNEEHGFFVTSRSTRSPRP